MQTRILSTIFVVLCMAWTSGCASIQSSTDTPVMKRVDHQFELGQSYIVETTRASDGAKIAYHGTVSDVKEDLVVFDSPRLQAKVTQSLGIPLVGRMFKNVGIGEDQLDGPVPVRRDQIVSVKVVDEK